MKEVNGQIKSDLSTDHATNEKSFYDGDLNHYFGLTLETKIYMQYGGYITPDLTDPMVFEFTGDDDVWIFIDGKLAADLGGVHDTMSLSIDFSTGNVTTWCKATNVVLKKSNLGELMYGAGSGMTTLEPGEHTLKMFYLERGNNESNMRLEFNTTTIQPNSVIKVDQEGNPISGVEFDLYADVNGNGEIEAEDEFISSGTTNKTVSIYSMM